MLFFGARDFREFAHVFNGRLAKIFHDQRQQAMPRAIAEESGILIRRILAPVLCALAQQFVQRGSPENEQRSHYLADCLAFLFENNSRMNAREPANTGAAEYTQQNGLCLIVESVGSRNFRDATVVREFAKKLVAQFTRRRLDAGTGAVIAGGMARVNWRRSKMQFEAVLLRQLRDEALVIVRLFSAQLVIDMGDRQHHPQLFAQIEQQAKECPRIPTA